VVVSGPHQSVVARDLRRYLRSWRAMTMRWIWLVPS
jgi:hypothetical protein